MPKGYWIANVEVRDAETYDLYRAANAEPFQRFGGRFLVRAGAHEVLEGQARPRIVVIEFPSYEAARACYNDPAYQAAKDIRVAVSEGDLVIAEGYDP